MKIGDYIRDKACTLWQGEITREIEGLRIGNTNMGDVYVARRPDGEVFFISKEDAVKLGGDWPKEEK